MPTELDNSHAQQALRGCGWGVFLRPFSPWHDPPETPPHSGDDYLPRSPPLSLSAHLSPPPPEALGEAADSHTMAAADSAPYQPDGANRSQQGVERVRVGV